MFGTGCNTPVLRGMIFLLDILTHRKIKVFYLPTNAEVIVLKTILKFTLK